MPRRPRFLPPDNFYHIMNRGNNHLPIFTCGDDYNFYLTKLADLKHEHPFELYHYCLMDTHIHLLVKILAESDFSNFSKRLNLTYSSYFQRRYGFNGHFWQGRFKSQLIDSDPYLIQCGKYIELNPVRAQIVEKPEDYLWSSYRFYSDGEKNDLITEDIFFEELGKTQEERRENFKDLHIDEIMAGRLDEGDALAVGARPFVYNAVRKARYHETNKNTPYRKRGS